MKTYSPVVDLGKSLGLVVVAKEDVPVGRRRQEGFGEEQRHKGRSEVERKDLVRLGGMLGNKQDAVYWLAFSKPASGKTGYLAGETVTK